jgi:dolichyl-diphosphooligosaccharide--protein glycosyltransferase
MPKEKHASTSTDLSTVAALLYIPRQSFKLALICIQLVAAIMFAYVAYDIRLYPIQDYGMVIHEFDPWFNYRAAEYYTAHGMEKFFKWYDYMSWYPLGRPIGTTIYPGMQMAASWIYYAMQSIPATTMPYPSWLRWTVSTLQGIGFTELPALPSKFKYAPMSVNDICCMMPPWFGASAAVFTGLIAYEVTRSTNAGIAAVGIMAIIPAHLMRSVGGEFDNEAVAMTAICATFWLWMRSVRNPSSWPWSVLAGVSYIYMVAAWGGYIFVINMIGVHALMLVGLGRFNTGIHKAYTIFFVIGTAGAIQIPVVGMQPLRSMEQMGPLLVFLGYQVLRFCDFRRKSLSTEEFIRYRIKVMIIFGAVLLGVAMMLWPTGYFGPLSARIRGLFVRHTKTGNPLVDSVAEHQPASSGIYGTYLNLPLDYVPLGVLVLLFKRNNAAYFVALYGFIASHFSGKMSRLVLICAPICTVFCAVWCGFILDFMLEPILLLLGKKGYKKVTYLSNSGKSSEAEKASNGTKENGKQAPENGKQAKANRSATPEKAQPKDKAKSNGQKRKVQKVEAPLEEWEEEPRREGGMGQIKRMIKREIGSSIDEQNWSHYEEGRVFFDGNFNCIIGRLVFSVVVYVYLMHISDVRPKVDQFVDHCHQVARQLGNPKVMFKHQQGKDVVIIDDYWQGYKWIDKNTPKDARIMAWWDYGYQITGIANRTSIADGNTWNHEHIATLGRTLTSTEKKAHNTIRHWADYVLVWAGGRGDDLAKSPHLARIGNSVFPDHCGDDDPKCTKFGFHSNGVPTKMMANSLLYKAVQHNMKDGVSLSRKYFEEVHTTKHGLLRVFKVMNVSQESKDWMADPANRVCDAPGSWYCVGQFAKALEPLLAKRRSFSQVEDFNRKDGEKSAYTKMIEKERAGKSADL